MIIRQQGDVMIFFYLLLIPIVCIAKMAPEEALQKLLDGNKRYMTDSLEHPNRSQDRREATTTKQKPFAVVISCSDSRVSPDIVFDQGVGDLFVVRVAGNVIGPLELESIEYAVQVLETSLILVMGHKNCGAIEAVIKKKLGDHSFLKKEIQPSVDIAQTCCKETILDSAIRINAQAMRDKIASSPIILQLQNKREIALYASFYNLKTGEVELLHK